MAGPEPAALPLGYSPIVASKYSPILAKKRLWVKIVLCLDLEIATDSNGTGENAKTGTEE